MRNGLQAGCRKYPGLAGICLASGFRMGLGLGGGADDAKVAWALFAEYMVYRRFSKR